MFIISTSRLQLIPLNPTQLSLFRSDPELALELLGLESELLCTKDTMGNNLAGAFDYWEKLLKKDPINYPWHTTWHIVLKAENKRIGRLGFSGIPRGQYFTTNVGYAMDEQYQNKGYMTEALQAAMHWAFQHEELQYLLAETYPNNHSSHRVLEKCGFGIIEEMNAAGNILWRIQNEIISTQHSQTIITKLDEIQLA